MRAYHAKPEVFQTTQVRESILEHVVQQERFVTRWYEAMESWVRACGGVGLDPLLSPTWFVHVLPPPQPCAVWFVGLPGSGKTVLAASLFLYLLGLFRGNVPLVMIDGDLKDESELLLLPGSRVVMTGGGNTEGKDFSPEARLRRARESATLASSTLGSVGGIVIGATFCPLIEQRQALRDAFEGRLLLVHVNTPIEACRKRREQEGYYTDPWKDPGIAQFVVPDATTEVPAGLVVDTVSQGLYGVLNSVVAKLTYLGFVLQKHAIV